MRALHVFAVNFSLGQLDRIELYWQQFLASLPPEVPRPARFIEPACSARRGY